MKPNTLSAREREVLALVVESLTNYEIAVRLGISPHTVKHHLVAMFDKTGVDSRLQLAMWANHHLQFRAEQRE